MGSPLAPVLANIFIGFHESKWLNEYNLNKPKFNLATSKTWTRTLDPEETGLWKTWETTGYEKMIRRPHIITY